MSSWQGKVLTACFRLSRILFPPPRRFDYEKDRAAHEKQQRFFKPLAPAERQPVTIGTLTAEWLVPSGIPIERTFLFLHGGGFIMGSIQSHRSLATNIAHATHARTLVIDYRLAPEHPFPAALEDCLTAYRWLLENGVRPEEFDGRRQFVWRWSDPIPAAQSA